MQVRVLNLNIHPYKEKFRDQQIEIPANGEILMDEDEAQYLLDGYCAPIKDSQGRPDPLHFKKLKIHEDDLRTLRTKANNPLVCHANGQKAVDETEMARILENFSHMLAGRDETAESEVIKKQNSNLKKENKELKSRLDLIEEKLGLKGEKNDENL